MCAGHDYSRPGKPKIDWDDPDARDALVSVLVNDANALVTALDADGLDERAASALALLALVAGQDVEPAEGSDGTDGRWRIARKVAEDRVVSTVDPDARHTRKSPEARRDGYRAHVVADPETGIITGEKLTRAAGQDNSDPAAAEEFLAAEAAGEEDSGSSAAGETGPDGPGGRDRDGEGGGGPLAWYGDSAYGTGDLRGAIDQAGHHAVIKPKPLQAPVKGGFTVDDFTVSEEQGTVTVTCPAGHTVTLSRTRIATFGVLCRDCPLRARCTTCKTGRKFVLHPRDDLLRADKRRPVTQSPEAGFFIRLPRQAPPDTAEVSGSAGVRVQVSASSVRGHVAVYVNCPKVLRLLCGCKVRRWYPSHLVHS